MIFVVHECYARRLIFIDKGLFLNGEIRRMFAENIPNGITNLKRRNLNLEFVYPLIIYSGVFFYGT